MNGGRVGFSGSTVRRLTPVRGFYYDVLGFHGYKRYIGASSIYITASSFLLIRPPLRPGLALLYRANQMPARFSRLCRGKYLDLSNTRRETLVLFSFFSSVSVRCRQAKRSIQLFPLSSLNFFQNLEERKNERTKKKKEVGCELHIR